MARRRLLLLLLLLVASLAVASSYSSSSPTRGVTHGESVGRRPVPSAADISDEEDEDEDEDDPWELFGRAADPEAHEPAPARACAASLPAARLDDDYCDCEADGSDEPHTAACSHVVGGDRRFACRVGDQRVPLAFVGDGVCDCCDGSDEPAAAACPDACLAHYRRARDRLAAAAAAVDRGLAARDAYLLQAPAAVAEAQRDLRRALAAYRELLEEVQRLQEALRVAGAPPSAAQLERLAGARRELAAWQNRAFVAQRVASGGTFGEDARSWKRAFAALAGRCFSAMVDEKQLKGGTPNVVPRTYEFRLCPFQNVSQREPAHAEWAASERRRKHADLGGAGAEREREDAAPPAPREVVLGVWDAWTGDALEDAQRRPVAQRFDHGEICAATGRERAVLVEVACGDRERVESVDEPEMCVYHVRFVSPAACDAAQRDRARRELSGAQALVDELEGRERERQPARDEL